MENPKKPVRLYSGPDADMLQQMRTAQATFADEDQALFAAVRPTFTAAYAASWLTQINLAAQALPNAARVGALKEDTDTVDAALEAARTIAKRVLFYANEAFPGNQGRLDTFGKSLYDAARANPARLQGLLEMQLAQLTTGGDEAALVAKGFPAGVTPATANDPTRGVNQLRAALATLRTAETTQERRKGLNQEDTAEAISRLNAAFAPYKELARAAPFVDWPADSRAMKRAYYTLPDSGPEDHDYSLGPGETAARRFDEGLAPGRRLSLSGLPAGAKVEVGLAPDAGTPPTAWTPVPAAETGKPVRLTLGTDLATDPKQTCVALRNTGGTALKVRISLLGPSK